MVEILGAVGGGVVCGIVGKGIFGVAEQIG